MGLSRNTARRYLRDEEERRYGPRALLARKLDPCTAYLEAPIAQARPCWIPATVLLREIRQRGYPSVSQLKAYLTPFKQSAPEPIGRFETAPGKQMQVDFTTIRRRGRDRLPAFVATTLGVSRSKRHERLQGRSRPRCPYANTEDGECLPLIRSLVDERPTHAHRRIGALLNRQRSAQGLPRLNHKRTYRLMAQNGMLLGRHTGKPQGRPHEEQIITIRPKLRWAPDGFEIPCWSAEVVRIAFAPDTCEREVTAWQATTAGSSGEMIRDLMIESVEYRFDGVAHTRHPIEWLSDNNSCYRAHSTQHFARDLGLVPCFAPVRGPESNGMAEAFAKGFKRDYVFVHDRPDARTVLVQLPGWFEDCNESHPHKALRLKSPRDFSRRFHKPAACPV
jgi:transposase InsO family protein